MTREEHVNLWREHNNKAMSALRNFRDNVRRDEFWQEYLRESRIANKHWGIAQMMFTKKFGKIS